MRLARTTPAILTVLLIAGAAGAADRTAPTAGSARDRAMGLYHTIDTLLAEGRADEARERVDAFRADDPEAAAWTKSLDRELEVIGKPAPTDWSIETWYQGGEDVDLDGERPTLVLFWEQWCPHCRAEVPKIQAIQDHYAERGLQIVAVTRITRTATDEAVREFVDESGVTYPVAKETGDLAAYFNVKGIPAAAIVRDGAIVWRGHPIRLTDDVLDLWF